MKRTIFEIGDYVHSDSHSGKYEIADQIRDRENNIEYIIQNIRTGNKYTAYPESLTEWDEWINSAQKDTPGLKFPSFKSYGLTKEQVFEVVMLFMTHMDEFHKDLAEEAMADNNYQWATAFLNVKILEDKIWHRFVQD